MKHCYICLLILIPCLTLCNCHQNQNSRGYKYIDMLDREVVIAKIPERIVSLAPSNTEIIFALDAQDLLVGVTTNCDYPPEATQLKKVGDFRTPKIELIFECEPDLVLAGNRINQEAIPIIENAGITVIVTEAYDFSGVYKSILDIGRITGTIKKAEALVMEMKKNVNDITEKVKIEPRPTCYYIVSFGEWGNWTAGPGSFIHEMIEMAGGNNITSDLNQPWATYSMEKLLQSDPEILLAGKHSGDLSPLTTAPFYKDLTAVKTGTIHIIDDNLVTRPGPRLVQGLEIIARAIHPEIFN